jgi:hypothetical protein
VEYLQDAVLASACSGNRHGGQTTGRQQNPAAFSAPRAGAETRSFPKEAKSLIWQIDQMVWCPGEAVDFRFEFNA